MTAERAASAPRADAEDVVKRYERLRAQVLSGAYRQQTAGGLGRLVRQGMCAWMQHGVNSETPAMTRPAPSLAAPLPFAPLHAQFGVLIAEMIIPRLGEITA